MTFGTYTLKSGRISPYFFNIGVFCKGSLLYALSNAFSQTIAAHSDPAPLEFDILFGPAYKGIPLAATTVEKLALLDEKRFGEVSYAFNRKEVKAYGDGGSIVGAPLKGKRVLIIDDVMTAGTAIRESVEIIMKEGGTLVGVVVALDRQEKAPAKEGETEETPRASAVGEVRKRYGVPVLAILTLNDIIEGFKAGGAEEDVAKMEAYREKYKPTE